MTMMPYSQTKPPKLAEVLRRERMRGAATERWSHKPKWPTCTEEEHRAALDRMETADIMCVDLDAVRDVARHLAAAMDDARRSGPHPVLAHDIARARACVPQLTSITARNRARMLCWAVERALAGIR